MKPPLEALASALDKIQSAQHLLEDAAQDLSPVDGAADEWQQVMAAYDTVKATWYAVERRQSALAAEIAALLSDP